MFPNGIEMTSQVQEDQARNQDSERCTNATESEINSEPKNRLIKDTIIIRRFKPSDLEGALDLDREVFGGYDPTIFTTFYEYHPRTTLVAELRGCVVGFVLGFKHTPLEGRVFWLAVRPGYQSRGVGRKLLTSILRTFRFMEAVSATLEVRISNKKAQALYSGMGFEMITIYPGYYSDGEPAIIMKRRL
jgi:ribosomal-protein-alanine N-acetyltransferase